MKLLYAYIDNFNGIIEKQSFVFSNEYIVDFESKEGTLKIEKNNNYVKEFYGKNISSITAIIGKNGVGKTTLLNIIGRTLRDRLENTIIDDNITIKDKYFLLYHVEGDIFFIEIMGDITIKNLNVNYMIDESVYNSAFFSKEDFNEVQYDEVENEKIIYINSRKTVKYHDISSYKSNELKFIPREVEARLYLADWYETFLKLSKKGIIESDSILFSFKKNKEVRYDDSGFRIKPLVEDADHRIKDQMVYIKESISDFFIFFVSCIVNYFKRMSLECCGEGVISFWKEISEKYYTRNNLDKEDFKELFNLCRINVEHYADSLFHHKDRDLIEYMSLIENLVMALFDIKEKVIPNIDDFKIVLSSHRKDEQILRFFEAYDKVREWLYKKLPENEEKERWGEDKDVYRKTDLKLCLPIQVDGIGISTGENNIISLFSKIIHEAKVSATEQKGHRPKKNYIILVDEIEAEMHLEWSRNLIDTIVEQLDEIKIDICDGFTGLGLDWFNVSVQIIFTTHSPFLISDLNRNSIIALEKKSGKLKQKKDVCSFAQNLQRIISNEFFISDCYGAFAQKKIKEIIDKLNGKDDLEKEKLIEIESVIKEIGEPLLRDKLMSMYISKRRRLQKSCDDEINKLNLFRNKFPNLDDNQLLEELERIKILLEINTNDKIELE